MSSITGLKRSPCWLGMFSSNTLQIKSADLFSASAQLGTGVSEVQQSLWSSQVSAPLLQLFQLVQKGKEWQ